MRKRQEKLAHMSNLMLRFDLKLWPDLECFWNIVHRQTSGYHKYMYVYNVSKDQRNQQAGTVTQKP